MLENSPVARRRGLRIVRFAAEERGKARSLRRSSFSQKAPLFGSPVARAPARPQAGDPE